MLSFSGGLKVFVALEPVDLRKNRAERDSQRAEPLPAGQRRRALATSAGWRDWLASGSAKICGRGRCLFLPTGGIAA